MLILGIETSCDETSVAVLRGRDEILSNIVSSSLFRHQEFGGVVPEIASRHCLEQIDFVFTQALQQAGIRAQDLNLIAVTKGPGLIGSLFVGMGFGKSLSYQLGIPLVAVNHLEAHFAANFIAPVVPQAQRQNKTRIAPVMPEAQRQNGNQIGKAVPEKYIGLLVSGGHTSLTYFENGKYELLGETEDDAVGEAYDKVAKIIGLDYPGGPALDKLAAGGNPRAILFKKPKQAKPLDFSFSGIKTAVLYAMKEMQTGKRKADAPRDEDLAASFQFSVVRWLVEKTLAACELKNVSNIVVGGGVSANSHLRAELQRQAAERNIQVFIPSVDLTGDNAAMIARRGYELCEKGHTADLSLTANPNLRI